MAFGMPSSFQTKPATSPFGSFGMPATKNPATTMPNPGAASTMPWSAMGQSPFGAKGLFGINTPQGAPSTIQPKNPFGMGTNPAPSAAPTNTATAMPNPWATGPTITMGTPQDTATAAPNPWTNPTISVGNPQTKDTATAAPNPWAVGPTINTDPPETSPYQPPQAPDNGSFNTQYATLDNLKPYMNPYLDQIINRGTNAIEHSAAGRGLFGSSGNVNDIGDWATKAQSNEFNNAFDRFTNDRGYMTDNYWKNRIANTGDYQYDNNQAWDQYKYGNSDYLTRLLGDYTMNNGLVGTGQSAANTTGGIYGVLGNALAGIYGDQGNTSAAGIMGNSKANQGFIGSILGALLGG